MQFNTPPFAYKQGCAAESVSYFLLPPRSPRGPQLSLNLVAEPEGLARSSTQLPSKGPGVFSRFPTGCQHPSVPLPFLGRLPLLFLGRLPLVVLAPPYPLPFSSLTFITRHLPAGATWVSAAVSTWCQL